MKYASKADFVDRMHREHTRFLGTAAKIPEHRYDKPGVWGKDWTVKDLFAHLTAWEGLFFGWHEAGLRGQTPAMPADGYKWNQTPQLNEAIWRAHEADPWHEVRNAFDRSFERVCVFVDDLDERDLLEPGRFEWTGKHPMVSYFGANTASHYASATKILQRWIRAQSD
ncbi:MAG: ClbS/DfsB family four-helix bundle protein [Planctomycetota bacterium]